MDQQTALEGTKPKQQTLARMLPGMEIIDLQQASLFATETQAKAEEAGKLAGREREEHEAVLVALEEAEDQLSKARQQYRGVSEHGYDLSMRAGMVEGQVSELQTAATEMIELLQTLGATDPQFVGQIQTKVRVQRPMVAKMRAAATEAQGEVRRLGIVCEEFEAQVAGLRVQEQKAVEILVQARREEEKARAIVRAAHSRLDEAEKQAQLLALIEQMPEVHEQVVADRRVAMVMVATSEQLVTDDLLSGRIKEIALRQKRPWWQFLFTLVVVVVRGWQQSRAAGRASKAFRKDVVTELVSLPNNGAKVALLKGYQRKLQAQVEEEDQNWYDRAHTPGWAHVRYEIAKAVRAGLTLLLTVLAVGLLVISPVGGRGMPDVIWQWYQLHQPAAWAGFVEVCLGIVLAGFLRQWLKPDAQLRTDRARGHKGWDLCYHHFLGYLPLGGMIAVAIDVGLGAVVAAWLLGIVYPHTDVDNTTIAAVFSLLQFPFGGIFYVVRVIALFGTESRVVMDLKWVEGQMAGIGKKQAWWSYVVGGASIVATLGLLMWGMTQYVSTLVDFLSLQLGYVRHVSPALLLQISARTDTASVEIGFVFAIISSVALGILQEGFPDSFGRVSSLCLLGLGSTVAGLPGSLAPAAGIWSVGLWGREMRKTESVALGTVFQQAAGTLLGLLTVIYQLLFLNFLKKMLAIIVIRFKGNSAK